MRSHKKADPVRLSKSGVIEKMNVANAEKEQQQSDESKENGSNDGQNEQEK